MRPGNTISAKIWITCFVLLFIITAGSLISGYFFRKIKQIDQNISGIYMPSVNYLTRLEVTLNFFDNPGSFLAIQDTLLNRTVKEKFEKLKQVEIPAITRNLNKISTRWPAGEQQKFHKLSGLISDSLVSLYESLLMPETEFVRSGVGARRELTGNIEELTGASTEAIRSLKNKFEGMTSSAIDRLVAYHSSILTCLIISGIFLSMTVIITIFILVHILIRPLNQFRSILQNMARGKLPQVTVPRQSDEIGQIGVALNDLTGRLNALSKFSEEIGVGNYDGDFQPLSEYDTLGNALIRMRENLKSAAAEDLKHKVEDERRNWANQGIARFSDILREHNNDIEKLNEAVINNLVHYTNARVGALFLHNKDANNNFLELVAAYAYDRMKYLRKEIQPGEGLAGRCFQEGETIYLTDVPDDYIKIRSGLGEDNPTSILIAPLKLHENVLGVIELASFEPFEPYKIDFVERICTSIASTIAAMKTGTKRRPRGGQGRAGLAEVKVEEEQASAAEKENQTETPPYTDKSEQIRKKLEEMLKNKK